MGKVEKANREKRDGEEERKACLLQQRLASYMLEGDGPSEKE